MKNVLFGLVLFWSTIVFADPKSFGGYIHHEQDKYFLLQNEIPYELYSSDPRVTQDLLRFADGDYVQVLGHLIESQKTLYVSSFVFVGLKTLLGKWRSPSLIFNFQDFSNLQLHSSNLAHLDKNWRNYHYTIAPGEGDQWTIFIVDNSSINIGKLTLTPKRALLVMVNPDNGVPEEIFDLHRLK